MLGIGIAPQSLPAMGKTLVQRAIAILKRYGSTAEGVWYDPSDMKTMFQDAAGLIPVTAVEQPVGLILDKSKGLVLGATLANVSTQALFNATGVMSGVGYNITATGNFAGIVQGETLAQTWYEIKYIWSGNTSARSVEVNLGSTTAGFGSALAGGGTIILRSGAATGLKLYLGGSASGNTVYFAITSVRELPGNHASQTVSTKRPTLSARVNLLTKTEDFSDAAWAGAASFTVDKASTLSPIGTMTGNKLTGTAAAAVLTQSTIATTTAYKYTVYKKAGNVETSVYFRNATSATNLFSLSPGVAASGSNAYGSWEITDSLNGWTKVEISVTSGVSVGNSITVYASGPIPQGDYVYRWGASLVPADQASLPYQRVNTATDYDAVGFPLRLAFDGVDDALVTPSIDFTATDKMTVVAGVRGVSASGTQQLLETSVGYANNTGAFQVSLNEVNAGSFAFARKSPVGTQYKYQPVQVQPRSSVFSALSVFSVASPASAIAIRENGLTIAGFVGGADAASTYGNYPLYIGSRAGTSLPFNGNLHQLAIFGATLTAAELAIVERYVGRKTGVTL